jgi:hypothetical protein
MIIKYDYNFIINLKNNYVVNEEKLDNLKLHQVPILNINKKQKQINIKYQSNKWRYNDKEDIFKKKLNGILNKISVDNYNELKNMIENIGNSITLENYNDLEYFVDRIINKAINDVFYIKIYGKLLQDICKCKWYCKIKIDNITYISFYELLLNKLQILYEDIYNNNNTNKQNCIGIIELISQIYNHKLLSSKIFISCIYGLLSNPSEMNIELLCKMINITKCINIKENIIVDIFDKINIIYNTISNTRLKYMLLDNIEIYNNNWKNINKVIENQNDIEEKLNNIIDEYIMNENIDDIIYIISKYDNKYNEKLIEMIIKYSFNLNKEKIKTLYELCATIIHKKKISVNTIIENILNELDDIRIDYPKANEIIDLYIRNFIKKNFCSILNINKILIKTNKKNIFSDFQNKK